MHGIGVLILFGIIGVIFVGLGFLIQVSVNKIQKNKWAKFVPAVCLLALLVFITIRPVLFFYNMFAGFTLIGTIIGLVLYYRNNKKEN